MRPSKIIFKKTIRTLIAFVIDYTQTNIAAAQKPALNHQNPGNLMHGRILLLEI